MFEVNYIAVLVAGLVPVILGMIWYNPKVFGGMWMRLANLSPEAMERGKKLMPFHALIGLVGALVMAYVLTHFGIAWGVFDWIGAIELGFWVWLGFQVPVLLSPTLSEMKPWKLFFLNAAYQLVATVLVAVVLVLFI